MVNKVTGFAFLIILTLLLLPKPAFANMVFTPMQAVGVTGVFVIRTVLLGVVLSFVNSIIEFFVIASFLRKKVRSFVRLLKSIFIINLITAPPTLLLAFFISGLARVQAKSFEEYSSIHYEIYLAEFLPFIGEYFLIKWQLNKLFKNGFLNGQISNTAIWILTISANLVSTIAGIIIQLENYYKFF